MPLTLTGAAGSTINLGTNGSITGLAVGGVPDGTVDADALASNAVTSGKLASGVGGKIVSYAIIADVKADHADGGTFTSGAYRTRDLNTEITDPDGIVSISSNQFTLQAGTYLLKWRAPYFDIGYSKTRLANITDTSYINGEATFGRNNPTYQAGFARGVGRVTISGAKVFEIQHVSHLTKATEGFGLDHDYTAAASEAIYTTVEIYKEA